ncbi:MAG: DNA polymerase III subunit epsilon [Alphaproteobacteria bacterium]|nr:DNA polymerase III subunit epsilon [Alphaproteobacteria bacterium]
MREIVLDTETTGLSAADGHRVVEIGCLELVNYVATGKSFHVYINPERDMPAEAAAVHGLTDTFLADKPVFSAVAGGFLEFVASDPLVIHNAAFDMGFLNAELALAGFPALESGRAIDTVGMARRKYPGQRASLDALCDRFGIDRTGRTLHGALLDAQLLAEVYLELRGGRQPGLAALSSASDEAVEESVVAVQRAFRKPRSHVPGKDELAAHEEFLKKISSPLWKQG